MNLCGEDRPEEHREVSVINISKGKVEMTQKGRHCKGRIKNYLKIQKLVVNVSKLNRVYDLIAITGLT